MLNLFDQKYSKNSNTEKVILLNIITIENNC